jgi:hypothetical protein
MKQWADLEIIITFGENSWTMGSGVLLLYAKFNGMTNEIWTSRLLLFTINDTCIKRKNFKPIQKGGFLCQTKNNFIIRPQPSRGTAG